MRHRRWARLRAAFGGYFWKPCPNCQQMFGGHEEGGGTLWTHSEGLRSRQGWGLCPECPGDIYAPGYQGYRSTVVTQRQEASQAP